MIVERQIETSAPEYELREARPITLPSSWPFLNSAVFLGLFALICFLQVLSGAYGSEFSAYPDEPAHYVTSVMLRDYLVHFHFESPMRFAGDYYHHYPKVAFGHWPPVFYILQSVWMMLFSASRASIRLEIAATSALLGYVTFAEARRWFGWIGGVTAGVLTVCLPLVQDYSDQEMSEALLTLLCFLSVVYFARYLSSERLRDSLLFGIFFALAVLTKGSGWLLVMVPPIVLVLTRRLRLLGKVSFWAPALLVAVTCVPWQLMTMRLAERGWDGGTTPSVSYTLAALSEFLTLFPKILGPVLVIFLCVGIWAGVVRPFLRGRVEASHAAQFALLLSVWVFHSIVPAGVEDRKLVIAVPSMVLLLFLGGRFVAELVPAGIMFRKHRYWWIVGVSTASFLLFTFTVPKIHHYSFIEAAGFLTHRDDLKNDTILVSSQSGGEGLLISEMAMDRPQPTNIVLRATKTLADVAWNGMNYHATYSNPAAIADYLREQKVDLVILDTFPPQTHFEHDELLRKAIRNDYSLIATFPGHDPAVPGQVQVFQLHH